MWFVRDKIRSVAEEDANLMEDDILLIYVSVWENYTANDDI